VSGATAGVPIGDGRARAGLCAPADRRADDARRLPGVVGPAGGGVSGGTGVVLLGDGRARAGLCAPADRRADDARPLPGVAGPAGGGVIRVLNLVLLNLVLLNLVLKLVRGPL
jgi:hypothetical protein